MEERGITGTVVGELADAVEHEVDDLLADGVVAAGVVVGSVLLAGDELLGVVQLAVRAGAHLVDDARLEVDEDGAGDVLAGAGLGEEGVEGVVAAADGLVGRHLAIRLDAVLEAVQLPAGVARLDAALAKVDRDDLTHFFGRLGGFWSAATREAAVSWSWRGDRLVRGARAGGPAWGAACRHGLAALSVQVGGRMAWLVATPEEA